jgi:hypothetical protein
MRTIGAAELCAALASLPPIVYVMQPCSSGL